MHAFSYVRPTSTEGVLSSLADKWGTTELLAGGTDLLSILKEGLGEPEKVVSLKGVKDLRGISVGDEGVRIGSMATLAEVVAHDGVAKHLPAIRESLVDVGGPQIRNMGTLGGNLCQRNRDWYFRLGLNPTEKVETRYGAIFPVDGVRYVHPSSLAPVLLAYGAVVVVQGPGGSGKWSISDLYQVAKNPKQREVALAANDVVTGVVIPIQSKLRSAAYEVRERQSHDWPLVQAVAALEMEGEVVKRATIALGHVAPTPLRSGPAEAAITGKPVTMETATAAGEAAIANAQPTADNEYKTRLLSVAVKRALLAAVGNHYWKS